MRHPEYTKAAEAYRIVSYLHPYTGQRVYRIVCEGYYPGIQNKLHKTEEDAQAVIAEAVQQDLRGVSVDKASKMTRGAFKTLPADVWLNDYFKPLRDQLFEEYTA